MSTQPASSDSEASDANAAENDSDVQHRRYHSPNEISFEQKGPWSDPTISVGPTGVMTVDKRGSTEPGRVTTHLEEPISDLCEKL